MTEEQKPTAPPDEPTDTSAVEEPVGESIEESVEESETKTSAAPEDDAQHGDVLAERRGRMVSAGILSAVIVSLIVVLVAGIFQLSYRLMMKCPQDLSVNDPSPVLWEKIEASRLGEQPTGLTQDQLGEAGLKMVIPSAEGPAK